MTERLKEDKRGRRDGNDDQVGIKTRMKERRKRERRKGDGEDDYPFLSFSSLSVSLGVIWRVTIFRLIISLLYDESATFSLSLFSLPSSPYILSFIINGIKLTITINCWFHYMTISKRMERRDEKEGRRRMELLNIWYH